MQDDTQQQQQQYQQEAETKMDDVGGGGGGARIGMRKTRMALAASSKRPCDDGKEMDEEKLDEMLGDYLYRRNDMNESAFLEKIIKFQVTNRKQFVLKFIQKAIDGGKGERCANIIPKLLNEYILLSQELDAGFVEFFKGYTFEDNPQIAQATAGLLAPLLVENELNFSSVLGWILLDTLDNQPQDDMLKFYDGDGIRNYIRNSKTMTKAMELLAHLFKELKEVCFEDGEYVMKLLVEYDFDIGQFVNQNDLGKREEIMTEWKSKYGLAFA